MMPSVTVELRPNEADYWNTLGVALRAHNQPDEAIVAFRKAADAYFRIGNALEGQGKLGETITCFEKAVELNPKHPDFPSTLGAAHYRAGNWNAAIDAMDKSMQLRKGGDSNEWFFLAMAHWQLGEKDKAREWYDRAVQWMDKNQPNNDELCRFRAEAAELLGVKEKK